MVKDPSSTSTTETDPYKVAKEGTKVITRAFYEGRERKRATISGQRAAEYQEDIEGYKRQIRESGKGTIWVIDDREYSKQEALNILEREYLKASRVKRQAGEFVQQKEKSIEQLKGEAKRLPGEVRKREEMMEELRRLGQQKKLSPEEMATQRMREAVKEEYETHLTGLIRAQNVLKTFEQKVGLEPGAEPAEYPTFTPTTTREVPLTFEEGKKISREKLLFETKKIEERQKLREEALMGGSRTPEIFVYEVGKGVGRGVIGYPLTLASMGLVGVKFAFSPAKTTKEVGEGLVKKFKTNPPGFAGEFTGVVLTGYALGRVLGAKTAKVKETKPETLKGTEYYKITGTEKSPQIHYVYKGVKIISKKTKYEYGLKGEIGFKDADFSGYTVQYVRKSPGLLTKIKAKLLPSKYTGQYYYKDFYGDIKGSMKMAALGSEKTKFGLRIYYGEPTTKITGVQYKISKLTHLLKSPKEFKTTIRTQIKGAEAYRPSYVMDYYKKSGLMVLREYTKTGGTETGAFFYKTKFLDSKIGQAGAGYYTGKSTILKEFGTDKIFGFGKKISDISLKKFKLIKISRVPAKPTDAEVLASLDKLRKSSLGQQMAVQELTKATAIQEPVSKFSIKSMLVTFKAQALKDFAGFIDKSQVKVISSKIGTTLAGVSSGGITRQNVEAIRSDVQLPSTETMKVQGAGVSAKLKPLQKTKVSRKAEQILKQNAVQSERAATSTAQIQLFRTGQINRQAQGLKQLFALEFKQLQLLKLGRIKISPRFDFNMGSFLPGISYEPDRDFIITGGRKRRRPRKKGRKRSFIEKIILPDPFSVAESKLKFGKATRPIPTKKVWDEAEAGLYLKIPTREQRKRRKKR